MSLKQIAIGIQCVELGVDATAVAEIREPETVFRGLLERFLFGPTLAEALMSDQRLGGFGERSPRGPSVRAIAPLALPGYFRSLRREYFHQRFGGGL